MIFKRYERAQKWLREKNGITSENAAEPEDNEFPSMEELRAQANQDLKLDMLGLKPYVDEIVISGDLPAGKPERLPFDVMSERIGIPAGELLYVGDNPLNDVFASRNAGYIPVWVATTGTWIFGDLKRADYEIETIAEIPELVHKLNA